MGAIHDVVAAFPWRGRGRVTSQDVQSEQVLVARLLHTLYSEDLAVQFQLLQTAQEQLLKGGPRRLRHTLPALGFAGLALVRRQAKAGEAPPAGGASLEAVLQWLLGVSLCLAEVPEPLLALRLMLAAAHSASEEAGLELLAYEFMEQVRRRRPPSPCFAWASSVVAWDLQLGRPHMRIECSKGGRGLRPTCRRVSA